MKKTLLILCFALIQALPGLAQLTLKALQQVSFPESIPAGNYSGITWLGGNRYAVVNDKSAEDGFSLFEISLDSVSGEITSAASKGFYSSKQPNRDGEGIAYNPHSNTIFISGESDNCIKEYRMDGSLTGRQIKPAGHYRNLPANQGLEALSYNAETRKLWTCNESGTIYLTAYNDNLEPIDSLAYKLDEPEAPDNAQYYAFGVSAMTALDDGSLLMLEREFYVPHIKLGAFVNCKIYRIVPGKDGKALMATWRTKLSLFNMNIANYEGMCLGPTLSNGNRAILLVSDSQNQYAGVLQDWLKSFRMELSEALP